MEIHQVVASASAGDAVTDCALTLARLLRRVGPSQVYARYIDPKLDGAILPLWDFEAADNPDDIVVYHASIGEPTVTAMLTARAGRLVLVYHNVTPPEYFAELDPAFARLLAGGRAELELLRPRTDLALAVSAFNAAELVAMGFPAVAVSPLPLDARRLAAADPDPQTTAELADLDGPLVLFVGQLLPHKRPDLLLAAYHTLISGLVPEAHLALVGPARNERYRSAVVRFARELNLGRLHMPGWLTAAQLAAWYRRADVFVTMSEHEGVCVPLLEAMSFDVPVVARACAAIPETMAGAGVLLPAAPDPFLVAEALAELLSSDGLRAELVAAGRRRVAEVTIEAAEATFLRHLESVA